MGEVFGAEMGDATVYRTYSERKELKNIGKSQIRAHRGMLLNRIEVVTAFNRFDPNGKTECCDVVAYDGMDVAKIKHCADAGKQLMVTPNAKHTHNVKRMSNAVLQADWVFEITFLSQKDSLWTKVIVAIHGVGGKIHSEWTSTGKSCWLSILSEVRSLQRKGMYVFDYLTHKMGNGESTKFWLDHWHTRGIFKDIFPRLYALESSKDVTVSSKIGDTSLVCSFRRIPRGGIEQNQFDSLVELVRSVTIVPSADRWNWNLESTGIFSVASARRRIDEICLPNIGEETRWVKCVPIKINVLAWKIKTDALPTRFNISRRGIDIQDMSCPICDNAIESTDHLFFRCGLVRDIANKVLSWWNLDHANLNSYAEWKSWLVSIRMDSKLKKMFEGNAPLTEQQHASIFAFSHAVVERPFPSKLGSISKENNGLSVSTKPGTVEESGIQTRWTDNIFTMRQWFSKNFPQAKEQLEHLYNGCNEIFVYGVAHLHSGGVGTALYGERKTLTTMTFAELILDESARAKLKEKALDSDTNGQGKNSQDHEDPDDPYVWLKHDCVAIMAAFKIKEPYEHYGIVVNSHIYWDPKWADAKLAQAKYCSVPRDTRFTRLQQMATWAVNLGEISARSRRDLGSRPENKSRIKISDQNLGNDILGDISREIGEILISARF
ncbi:RNA-directed DNA polymerase, eukaryota, reverse transcriptase zinc-binding domain protein [Tanacetum coccineum]